MQLCCDRRLRGAAARCDAAMASRTSYKWTNQACLRGNSLREPLLARQQSRANL